MDWSSARSEIVFFDVETTAPMGSGQALAILEFGAILVCPRKLIELEKYSTLVRPANFSHVFNLSDRSNGITKEAVASAPTFCEIADEVFDILDGRIWAGHNILEFDCPLIIEAFAEINRPAPEPRGTPLDSLEFLKQRFGRRAGDMKMASLATYFGLGQQTHRSLDDVRMNLEVLKHCAAVLFMESSLPDLFLENSKEEEEEESSSAPELSPSTEFEASSNGTNFLSLEKISEASISAYLAPSFYNGTQKIQLLHKDVPLEVCCKWLKVRFGVNSKYASIDGQPKLSFVVDASPSLCRILDVSDDHAQKLSMNSGSTSDWRPVVVRKPGFLSNPTLRLNLLAEAGGKMVRWDTEIYHNEPSAPQRLIYSRFDELESLLFQDDFLDAYFSLDTYDYQQKAGIRLVAKKLIIHQN